MPPVISSRSLNAFLDFAGVQVGGPPLAVFDCDGTVVRGDIGETMLYRQLERFLFRVSPAAIWTDHPDRQALDELYKRLAAAGGDFASHPAYESFCAMVLDWYYGQMAVGRTPKACADIVSLLAGFTDEEAAELGRETLEAELSSPIGTRRLGGRQLPVGVRYVDETVRAVRRLLRDGWDVMVVSGSNRWSVQAVFAPLGVVPGKILGIDLKRKGETLEGSYVEPIPVADGKVKALRAVTRAKPDIVFSDSRLDIPLFREARFRVLVSYDAESADEIIRKAGGGPRENWHVISPPTLVRNGLSA